LIQNSNIEHIICPLGNGVVYNENGSFEYHYWIIDFIHNILFCEYSGSLEVSNLYFNYSSLISVLTSESISLNNNFINKVTYRFQIISYWLSISSSNSKNNSSKHSRHDKNDDS